MAIEPKSPRKRAVKKSKVKESPSVTEAPAVVVADVTPKSRKKAAVPVPIFQAPELDKAPARTRKAAVKAAPVKEEVESTSPKSESDSEEGSSDSESRSSRNL